MRYTLWIRTGLAIVALGVGGFAIRARLQGNARAATGREGAPTEERVVPVVAVTVEPRDMPIYLEGLGSVIASNTVTVKPQVDGRLDHIAFREGQEVHRGDVLAQIDPRPFVLQLHQAEAARARDEAQLRGHRQSLERFLTLSKDGLASQQQIDEAQATVDQSRATIQADQVQVEAAKLNLDYARITAPSDGVTGVRLVDPGNIVRGSDPTGIVVIAQVDPIAVLFTLPQDDLPQVSKQMAEGPITVEARGRDGEAILGSGQLALIDNQINQTTATIRLKATFANPDRKLWPNQFVKARLLLTTRKGARVVPASAVQRGPNGTFAYVIGPDQKAAVRPLQIEMTTGDQVLITSGIEPGDRVITEGQFQLRPGSRVALKPPSAPPLSSAAPAPPAASGGAPSGAGR
jgi:multidrug efflux system membrane fusion protein